MLREKMLWLIFGFLIPCIIGIPYHLIVISNFENKYEERCMVVEVIISEPFGGGRMRVEGEQMMCASNWKHSFIYFPGFDEHLERMWRDEQKEHPLVEKERKE